MEFESSEEVLKKFLNSCKSARKTISIWPAALQTAHDH